MAVLFLALLVAGDPLADARAAMDQLRYDRALESLDAAEHAGSNGPRQLTEIFRLRGEALAAMGRTGEAVLAFRRWLALEPAGALPAGSSPKIARPFQQAKRDASELRVHHEAQSGLVTLIVDADPLNLVVGARARFRTQAGTEQTVEGRGTGSVSLVLPGNARLDVTLAAIDQYGNRLAEIDGVRIEPVAAVAPVREERPEAPPARVWSRWWLWGGAAVAIAGVGVAFGLASASAQDDVRRLNADSMHHDFAEAKAREDDANTDALLANIGYGVAGACAVVSGVLFYRERMAIVPAPTRGGGAVSVLIRF